MDKERNRNFFRKMNAAVAAMAVRCTVFLFESVYNILCARYIYIRVSMSVCMFYRDKGKFPPNCCLISFPFPTFLASFRIFLVYVKTMLMIVCLFAAALYQWHDEQVSMTMENK